jgi:hypothetical protein
MDSIAIIQSPCRSSEGGLPEPDTKLGFFSYFHGLYVLWKWRVGGELGSRHASDSFLQWDA